MEQIYNPYLPLTTYIPDGEPHVFDGRIYIFGSHDAPGGKVYCEDHYQVWSADADNLKDWKNEGTSYLRWQDSSNSRDQMQLWAPDAAKGADGRYYLYYCFPFYPEIGVAVADRPQGPYRFYGHVHYPASIRDGAVLRECMPFDPAVLVDDDGRVFLYYGFCPAEEKEMLLPEFTEEQLEQMPEDKRAVVEMLSKIKLGENSMVVELESDMITAKEEPRVLIPGGHHSAGTGFEGHAFFEASSIRKIRGKYYFVYSSHKSHELCYAVSDRPDRGFTYGGTIISNGDIGLNGREKPVYPLSNNHGGIAEVNGRFYIFYHRATDGTEFARQGCAEPIEIAEDGSIAQVEMTSCGLNGGPLLAAGTYPAGICCHLTDPTVVNRINYEDPVMQEQTAVTQKQNISFINKIKNRTVIGYKYFRFDGAKELLAEIRGDFAGEIFVSTDEEGKNEIGRAAIAAAGEDWQLVSIPLDGISGTHALYLTFAGTGLLDMKSLCFR